MNKKIIFYLSILIFFCITSCIKIPDIPVVDDKNLTDLQKKTLKSVKKHDDHPFYSMTYYADYKEIEYMNNDIIMRLSGNSSQCTTLAAHGKKSLFARNHDYTFDPVLIMFMKPKNGYASVSIVDMVFVGIQREKTNISSNELKRLLFAPFVPCDGMNEKGVAIGLMGRDDESSLWDTMTGKTLIVNTSAKQLTSSVMIMRMVLDNASSVDEAVAIFKNNRIYCFLSAPLHYLVSDRNGKSAIIEFANNTVQVMYNTKPWQVCTNHGIYMKEEIAKKKMIEYQEKGGIYKKNDPDSYWRYITAERMLKEQNGNISIDYAMKILNTVSMDHSMVITRRITDWSVVYDLAEGNIHVAVGKDYNTIYKFRLQRSF